MKMLQVALIKSRVSEDNKFVVMIIFYICSEIKVFTAVLSEEMLSRKTLKIPSKKKNFLNNLSSLTNVENTHSSNQALWCLL
jgi:hypothetical protein